MAALGVEIDFAPPRLHHRREQFDRAHILTTTYVRRRLVRQGFLVEEEVQVDSRTGPGWIDLLAFHPAARLLIVSEIKTDARDLGGLQRQVRWYEYSAHAAARRLGWRPARQVSIAVLLFTSANDLLVSMNASALKSFFPLRASELSRLLADPSLGVDTRRSRGMALVDPRSRRTAWLRPTITDGRRSPAPYRDYADFMRTVEHRRPRP
jgi:hypothetical protein